MDGSGGLTEADVRDVARDEVTKAGRSALSTALWTVLSTFSLLVGLQAVQIAFHTTGVAAVGFAAAGLVVTAASAYLLAALHWN